MVGFKRGKQTIDKICAIAIIVSLHPSSYLINGGS